MGNEAGSRRNIGIFAHVDAGKTTTTEHMLYESGRIRELGSVDTGTAATDSMEVEKERGISVRAAAASFEWKGVRVNLVDTPGHVDFLSEVERSMRVMDGAVLVVSAVEGVQAQTEVIWNALRRLGIPTVIFMNKLDRVGADPEAAMEQIRRYLSEDAVPVQQPLGRERQFSGCRDLWEAGAGEDGGGEAQTAMIEKLAEQDETLLNRYLNGELRLGEWKEQAVRLAKEGAVFPVLYGAAGKGLGITALLDAICDYLPGPSGDAEAPLSGVVFKVERDKSMGRLAYVRLYDGRIRNRDAVYNHSQDIVEKATQIRKADGRMEDLGVVEAGDIAIVCGMPNVRVGDVLGRPDAVPQEVRLAVPLLTVQAHWASPEDYPELVQALQELSDEDPLLDVQWMKDERELHVKVMGPIQLEILTHVLAGRYGLSVTFGKPSVIYKETPAEAGEGYIAYLMPKPCWAILRFRIEPGLRGSGLAYESVVRPDQLLPQYQNEVARRVPEALQQGLRGWEVVDLKVTLEYGEHHVWHTHPLDFVVATPMAIMNGLANVGTKLLEPILRFRIAVPEDCGGRVMHDMTMMRGTVESTLLQGDRLVLEGKVPAATSMEYGVELHSLTKGRGTLAFFFAGYEECPPDVQAERRRRGVNPLDQSKYILSVRNALQG